MRVMQKVWQGDKGGALYRCSETVAAELQPSDEVR